MRFKDIGDELDGLIERKTKETTEDWLECFDNSVKRGESLADSIFWRLAVSSLPIGVDGNDKRVKEAIKKIKASIKTKETLQ